MLTATPEWFWPRTHLDCLSRNVRVAAEAAPEVVELGGVGADALAAEPGVAEPVVEARGGAGAPGEQAVKGVREAQEALAGRAAKAVLEEQEELVEEPPGVAAEAWRIRIATTRIQSFRSRGASFLNFLPQRRPISRF